MGPDFSQGEEGGFGGKLEGHKEATCQVDTVSISFKTAVQLFLLLVLELVKNSCRIISECLSDLKKTSLFLCSTNPWKSGFRSTFQKLLSCALSPERHVESY